MPPRVIGPDQQAAVDAIERAIRLLAAPQQLTRDDMLEAATHVQRARDILAGKEPDDTGLMSAEMQQGIG